MGGKVIVDSTFSGSGVAPEIGSRGDFSGDWVVLSGERPSWFREAHTLTWQRVGADWVYRGEPVPQNPVGLAIFGNPASIDGNVLAVGARDDDGAGSQSGACFVFEWSGTAWVQQAKIVLAEPPFNNQETGSHVTVRGGKVYLSSPGNPGNGAGDRGRMFVVGKSGGSWRVEQELRPPETGLTTYWGYLPEVDIGGRLIVFGADSPSPLTTFRNIITVFAPNSDCNSNQQIDATDLLGGISADLDGNAVPDECESAPPGFVLRADSRSQFSEVQGQHGWRYLFDRGDGTAVTEMPYDVPYNSSPDFGGTVWCAEPYAGDAGSFCIVARTWSHTNQGYACTAPQAGLQRPIRQWSTSKPERMRVEVSTLFGGPNTSALRADLLVDGQLVNSWSTFYGTLPRIDYAVDLPAAQSVQFRLDPVDGCGADACHDFSMRIYTPVCGGVVPDCCPEDINKDGSVGGADIGVLLFAWGPNPPIADADVDRNGSVDGMDLAMVLSNWGPCNP